MVFALVADKEELKKVVARAFEKQGWKVTPPANAFLDIELNRNSVKFFVQCMDRTILNFSSLREILDNAEETSRVQASLKKTGVIYVFNFRPMTSFYDPLRRGIIAFHLDELDLLLDLDKRFETLSFLDDRRLKFMASNLLGPALIVCNSYRQKRDLPNAIEWARHAVVAGRGFSQAYRKLYQLMIETKDYKAAEEVMLEGLALQPSNLEVLKTLIKLAEIQKDSSKQASYSKRLEEVMAGEGVKINNFDELMQRTNRNSESFNASEQTTVESPFESTMTPCTSFAAFFKRRLSRLAGSKQ